MPKSLRVLCFGDSLTSGYHSFGYGAHPYSEALRTCLFTAFPDAEIKVRTNGVPGDVAAFPGFKDRFHKELSSKKYDWAIILVGTNDIAMGIPVENTFNVLKHVYNFAESRGCNVLALTVPETAAVFPRSESSRKDLNSRIMAHEAKNYYCMNLLEKIPYHTLNEFQKNKYWGDGVHLTEDGYDWMGEHIAGALIDIVQRRDEDATGGKCGENTDYEEERGNPGDISQGYIVVRKTDLH